MKLLENVEMADLALVIKKKVLVISDVHIGYEEYLNKSGILVPRFQFSEVIKRLGKIIRNKKFDLIIINGDVKHEFGTISMQEWHDTLRFIDFISKHAKKIILIKGNHDTILGPIASKRNIEILKSFRLGNLFFCHGDEIIENRDYKKSKTIIIGHEHPAISLREGSRIEKYKCLLMGKYKKKNLIVLPSFNLVNEGTDILKEELLSPYLQKNLDSFSVFIVSDKIYKFGTVKDIMSLK